MLRFYGLLFGFLALSTHCYSEAIPDIYADSKRKFEQEKRGTPKFIRLDPFSNRSDSAPKKEEKGEKTADAIPPKQPPKPPGKPPGKNSFGLDLRGITLATYSDRSDWQTIRGLTNYFFNQQSTVPVICEALHD